MSPPVLDVDPALQQISVHGLHADGERYQALTSALRRGARGEAIEILDRWTIPDDDHLRDIARLGFSNPTLKLAIWLKCEVRFHVEAARFQHALTLVERYATLPVPLDAAGARALEERINSR